MQIQRLSSVAELRASSGLLYGSLTACPGTRPSGQVLSDLPWSLTRPQPLRPHGASSAARGCVMPACRAEAGAWPLSPSLSASPPSRQAPRGERQQSPGTHLARPPARSAEHSLPGPPRTAVLTPPPTPTPPAGAALIQSRVTAERGREEGCEGGCRLVSRQPGKSLALGAVGEQPPHTHTRPRPAPPPRPRGRSLFGPRSSWTLDQHSPCAPGP